MNTLENKEQSELQTEQSVNLQEEQISETLATASLPEEKKKTTRKVQPKKETAEKAVSKKVAAPKAEKKVAVGKKKTEKSDEKNVEKADVVQEKVEIVQEKVDVKQKKVSVKKKKTDIPVEKTDIEPENVGIVEEKIDVVQETVDIVQETVDIVQEKANVEQKKVSGRKKKTDNPDEKTDIESEKVDVVQEKIDKKDKKSVSLSREELVEQLRELLVEPIYENIRTAAEAIKVQFYKRQKQEFEAKKREVQDTVAEKTEPVVDELEQEFKELFAKYREIKTAANAKIEEQKLKNLERKQAILEKLEKLTSSAEDLSTTIPAFRKLQSEWKKIEQVPQNMVTEIWKQYSRYQEKFYDLVKINNDLRDLDFKRNYEMKVGLCELAEKLEGETDAVLAFHHLQKLHEDWREIGPVAREVREEIWSRFKEASSKINKKHQAYFESLKDKEEENLRLKTDLCEKIEQIDFSQLKSFKQWDAKSAEVMALQNEWKEIGNASQKQNVKIFKRFRNACDSFFKNKNNFFQAAKTELAQNLEKKRELLAKAEELKTSTEWREATDKFIELQKEWKQIASSSRQYADGIWRKFAAACDYFFEQKELNFNLNKKKEEQANLKQKEEIIKKIKNYTPTGNRSDDTSAIKELMTQFSKVGFVPIKAKKKLQDKFVAEVDIKFEEVRSFGGGGNRRTGGGSERARLFKQHDTLKNEINTYENNIGFLTSSSKKGNALVDMMNEKVAKLKQELEKIVEKINGLES